MSLNSVMWLTVGWQLRIVELVMALMSRDAGYSDERSECIMVSESFFVVRFLECDVLKCSG